MCTLRLDIVCCDCADRRATDVDVNVDVPITTKRPEAEEHPPKRAKKFKLMNATMTINDNEHT